MTPERFVECLCKHMVACIAMKVSDPMTKFKIGLASAGYGRKKIEEKVMPMLKSCTNQGNELDLCELKETLKAGFDAAKEIPIAELGITIDFNDVEEFFAKL